MAPPWYNTVLSQMLKALEYLHTIGPFMHRDIKPENIFFNDIDHFVLGDFGNATIGKGRAGVIAGRLQFMAPEVYVQETQTPAADIWSLGILCLDMLDLLPILPGNNCTIATMGRPWCEAMCEVAKHCTRPEIGMMMRMEPAERATAPQLRTFLRNSPSSPITSAPVSEHLVYLVLKEFEQCKGLPKLAIMKGARDFLQRQRDCPATTSVSRSFDQVRGESELTVCVLEEGESVDGAASRQRESLGTSAASAITGSEGVGEHAWKESSNAAAKSLTTRPPKTAGPSSSTSHEVSNVPSRSTVKPPPSRPQRSVGTSTTSRPARGLGPSPHALTPEEQKLVDEIGPLATSRPSGSSKSQPNMRRGASRQAFAERSKKSARPSAPTRPPSNSRGTTGQSSSAVEPQPTSSQREAEQSNLDDKSSQGSGDSAGPSNSTINPQLAEPKAEAENPESTATSAPEAWKEARGRRGLTAKLPPEEPKETREPSGSRGPRVLEPARSEKGGSGSIKDQGLVQASEAVRASEAARGRHDSVLKNAEMQSTQPIKAMSATHEPRKSIAQNAETQASGSADARSSLPNRRGDMRPSSSADVGPSIPIPTAETQVPQVTWRGRPRELQQTTAKGSPQAVSQTHPHPTTTPPSQQRSEAVGRPASASASGRSTCSVPERNKMPDPAQSVSSRHAPPRRGGLSIAAPEWHPETKTWGAPKGGRP